MFTRNLPVRRGVVLTFDYAKSSTDISRRTGTVERIKWTAGKSSVPGNRKRTRIVTVKHEDGSIKTYHADKMQKI